MGKHHNWVKNAIEALAGTTKEQWPYSPVAAGLTKVGQENRNETVFRHFAKMSEDAHTLPTPTELLCNPPLQSAESLSH